MLSGLDVNTAQTMLDHVFGRHGICRKLGNAVILPHIQRYRLSYLLQKLTLYEKKYCLSFCPAYQTGRPREHHEIWGNYPGAEHAILLTQTTEGATLNISNADAANHRGAPCPAAAGSREANRRLKDSLNPTNPW